MNPKGIIKDLGGATALSKLTGISKSTIDKWSAGARGTMGPAALLLKILTVLHREKRLRRMIVKVGKIK